MRVNINFLSRRISPLTRRSYTSSTSPPVKSTMIEEVSSHKSFGGHWKRFKHQSYSTGTEMHFSIYLPPRGEGQVARRPILWYLSGLECNDRNFVEKTSPLFASIHGLVVVCPDTSPRGLGYPGEDDSWDFGTGAGMYVDATQAPWEKGYKMYSYINEELPKVIQANFLVDMEAQSIMGHSMGGHGALVSALRNPTRFASVSALAPICNPSITPWGIKAFTAYLGNDRQTWKEYDTVELLKNYDGPQIPLMVHQGLSDKFLSDQLRTGTLRFALKEKQYKKAIVKVCNGYDHSYFFVSSFMKEHYIFHAHQLHKKVGDIMTNRRKSKASDSTSNKQQQTAEKTEEKE